MLLCEQKPENYLTNKRSHSFSLPSHERVTGRSSCSHHCKGTGTGGSIDGGDGRSGGNESTIGFDHRNRIRIFLHYGGSERQLNDSGREDGIGSSAEEMAIDVAVVSGLAVCRSVVTGFKGSIDDGISAPANGTIRTADGIGLPGVLRTCITLFSGVDLTITTESKIGRVLRTRTVETRLSRFAGAVRGTGGAMTVDTEIGETLGGDGAGCAGAVGTGGACGTVEIGAASHAATVGAEVACALVALGTGLAGAIETEIGRTLRIGSAEDASIIYTEACRTVTIGLALHRLRRVVVELGEGGVLLGGGGSGDEGCRRCRGSRGVGIVGGVGGVGVSRVIRIVGVVRCVGGAGIIGEIRSGSIRGI